MGKDNESKRLDIAERNKQDVAEAQRNSDDPHVREASKGTEQEAKGIAAERDHHEGRTS